MRRSAALIIAIAAGLVVALAAAPAEAKKRVALFAIEGAGGRAATEVVDEVLQRAHTVVSQRLVARSRARLKVGDTLDDAEYASLAADLSADAVITGTWRTTGKRRGRLTLSVRSGKSGERVADLAITVRVRRGAPAPSARDAIAARLLPALDQVEPLGAVTTGPADAPEPAAPAAADSAGPAATADDDDDDDAATEVAAADTTGAEPEPEPAPAPSDEPVPAPAPAPAPAPDASVEADTSSDEGGLGAISGKAFAYLRAPVDGDPFQQVSASLWLSARPELTDISYAKFEVAIDAFDASQGGGRRIRAALREGYVALRKAGWLVRVGQQIIPWGSSDAINPTDFLTARDLSFFSTDTEMARVGAVSGFVSKAWSALEISVVATPVHAISTLLIPASALPAGVTLAPAEVREPRIQDTEVGAKIKASGSRWDLAVIGFRGRNHTPELELVSLDAMGAVIRQTNHRISAVGVDGSASTGKLILRAEGSYVITENDDGSDPTIQPSYAYAVIGAERPIGDRLRFQLQVASRYYPRWQEPASTVGPDEATTQVLRGIAASNALLLDYQDQQPSAATFRAAYTSEEGKLEAEVFAALNLLGGDYLVRPLVGWRPTDALTLQAGLEIYGGAETTPLGALEPFGGAFAQSTFAF